MDTGLGNKTSSIIGQGQIGNIIEQRPEEPESCWKRLPVSQKYRKKVAVSQKKIELTEINLQRVGDILSEIEKQIRSLKKAGCQKPKRVQSPSVSRFRIWNWRFWEHLRKTHG